MKHDIGAENHTRWKKKMFFNTTTIIDIVNNPAKSFKPPAMTVYLYENGEGI